MARTGEHGRGVSWRAIHLLLLLLFMHAVVIIAFGSVVVVVVQRRASNVELLSDADQGAASAAAAAAVRLFAASLRVCVVVLRDTLLLSVYHARFTGIIIRGRVEMDVALVV